MGCSPKKDYTRKNRFMLEVSLIFLITEMLIISASQNRNMLSLLGSKIDLNKKLPNFYGLAGELTLNQQSDDIDALYTKINRSNKFVMYVTYILMIATAVVALVNRF